MSARSLGILSLLATLYTGCRDQPRQTNTIPALSTTSSDGLTKQSQQVSTPQKPLLTLEELATEIIEIKAIHIVSESAGKIDDSSKVSKEGESVALYAVVLAQTKDGIRYFTQAPSLQLNGKAISPRLIQKLEGEIGNIHWHKLEAMLPSRSRFYDFTSDKSPDCKAFSDCNPIEYTLTQLKSDSMKLNADVHPTTHRDQFKDSSTGRGTMRFVLEVEHNGQRYISPGLDMMAKISTTDKVTRVSYIPDNGQWTDYLFEGFGMPYVWGSTTSMADRLIGTDCADLVVLGLRKAGNKVGYTNVRGLADKTRLITLVDTLDAPHLLNDSDKITTGPQGQVHQGDLLMWAPKQGVAHIAVFYKDNGDGYLGVNDLAVDTLFGFPKIRSIASIAAQVSRTTVPFQINRYEK